MARTRPSIGTRFGRLLKAAATFVGLAGITIIGLQCLWWFQDGYWSPKSVLDLWFWLGNTYTPMRGAGIARVVLFVLDLPVGATLLTVALFVFWAADRLTKWSATS